MSIARAIKPVATLSLSALESLLTRCPTVSQLNQVLSHATTTGLLNNPFAASKVLTFAANTSWVGVDYSLRVLNQAKNRNGFMWNVVMRAFVGMDRPKDAILLYKRMCLDENEDVRPDKFTYPILIHGCGLQRLEFEGREIHCGTLKWGFRSDVYVGNTMINMYSVCGNMVDATKVFDECPNRDSVSWNTLLSGYIQAENIEAAKLVFDGMPIRNLIASNSMIVLLGKKGLVVEARELFDRMGEKCMVSWSALVACYENNAMYEEALVTFKEMHSSGVMIDEVVMLTILSCSADFGVVHSGMLIHGLATKIGIASFVNLQNALIHMYSKCDGIKDAESLFNASYPDLDMISWNSMISGHMRNGNYLKKSVPSNRSQPRGDELYENSFVSSACFVKQLEKQRRADQELKKRVLKLEFCLQEARTQITRKLQRGRIQPVV
ncbi:hypothetical protein MLD38_023048 [Melastoma candidum]|uniref:Uncharacterized protein n=1 Tax=Melastoma candidum TaxID=119954 RepID=A0ACB9QMF7_9MYRT|nr:hypothetical protein MLD38_023048 [Melastoma candidum]